LENQDDLADGALNFWMGVKGFLGELCRLFIELGEALAKIHENTRVCETNMGHGVGICAADPDIQTAAAHEIGGEVEGLA
jgi:hypothetical protein